MFEESNEMYQEEVDSPSLSSYSLSCGQRAECLQQLTHMSLVI